MKNAFVALGVGFIFSLGLGISGMTQPQKVVGFLDVFGSWDPSLMFVMIGAIAVHFITYKLIRKRKSPLFSKQWHVPTKKEITPALIVGSFIFGIGWGLGGFCPGPAVTSLASFEMRPFIFVLSMLVGMIIFRQLDKKIKIEK
ncbi:MAG TPA: YeeE/YedE family protein [Pseudobdellovibrionaceae bacterium]|jgi:hypothetical protein